MAKSVLDASWGLFKSMLAYKSIRIGVDFQVTNEKYSTVTCSKCSARSGPRGLSALGVREWECSKCGSQHLRDVNAAKNILLFALGHESPLGESPSLKKVEDVNTSDNPSKDLRKKADVNVIV